MTFPSCSKIPKGPLTTLCLLFSHEPSPIRLLPPFNYIYTVLVRLSVISRCQMQNGKYSTLFLSDLLLDITDDSLHHDIFLHLAFAALSYFGFPLISVLLLLHLLCGTLCFYPTSRCWSPPRDQSLDRSTSHYYSLGVLYQSQNLQPTASSLTRLCLFIQI